LDEKKARLAELKKVFNRRILVEKGVDRKTIEDVLIVHEQNDEEGSIHDSVKRVSDIIKGVEKY